MKKLMMLLVLGVLSAVSLSAQSSVQNKKIRQGVRSGELTLKETVQLKKQQQNLKRTKRIAAADGVITKREQRKIATKNSKLNANIYRQKHDRQARK